MKYTQPKIENMTEDEYSDFLDSGYDKVREKFFDKFYDSMMNNVESLVQFNGGDPEEFRTWISRHEVPGEIYEALHAAFSNKKYFGEWEK